MTPSEIAAVRTRLRMTQGQLAQLLGVHPLTVSKWERVVDGGGVLEPSPYQVAILRAAEIAVDRDYEIGPVVVQAMSSAGIALALYHLLRVAFG